MDDYLLKIMTFLFRIQNDNTTECLFGYNIMIFVIMYNWDYLLINFLGNYAVNRISHEARRYIQVISSDRVVANRISD